MNTVIVTNLRKGIAALSVASLITAAQAVISYNQNVQPDVIFGSGNANGSFTVDRVGSIELGLRAKLRHNAAGAPENTFNSNGDGTYSFDKGVAPTQSFPTGVWSFEWAINTDVSNPVDAHLNDYTYFLGIDSDASLGTSFIPFDPINGFNPGAGAVLWDHSLGDNSTTHLTDSKAGNATDYANYIASLNVAQNSWKPHWFLPSFDPTVDGTYDIYLEAYSRSGGNGPVARTEIQVIVGKGGSPVPDAGSTLALLSVVLVAFGFIRRRIR